MKLMMGNYKPLSYIYLFLTKDLERITRLLSTGGVTMADLGSAGCAGVRPLDRKNLDAVLVATDYIRPVERTLIPHDEKIDEEKEELQAEEKLKLVMDIPEEEYKERQIISPWHGKPLF